MNIDKSIGIKLKTLRNGKKLTQEEVAFYCKCSRATLSNYEIGRRIPNLTQLKRFAKYYGVGLDYFGVVSTDEIFDLLSRAKEVFENEEIPQTTKEDLHKELMKLYLKIK